MSENTPTEAAQHRALVELDGKDLPAFCPNPRMPIWQSVTEAAILRGQVQRRAPARWTAGLGPSVYPPSPNGKARP